ncbi:MAG: helix-turn-helix transcriptional regulator [Bacteroidota bacterium]
MAEKMLMDNIRYLQKSSKLSRLAWAKKMQISDKTVGKWFEGLASPQTEHLVKISNKNKVSIDYLIRKDIEILYKFQITANYMFIQKLMKL